MASPPDVSRIARLRRGLFFRLAIGLLLGLLSSWLVALGLQAVAEPTMKGMAEPALSAWLFGRPALGEGADEHWIGFPPGPRRRPAWFLRGVSPSDSRGTIVHSYGWPARSLMAGRSFHQTEGFRDWGLWRSGGPETYAFPFDRAVVLWPLWVGSGINGVLYGALWWMLLGVPTVTVRIVQSHRHARRGRCPECGYDLAGQREAGCPECGWRRGPDRASAAR